MSPEAACRRARNPQSPPCPPRSQPQDHVDGWIEPAAAVAALCHYGGGGDSWAARWGSQHRVFRLHTAAQQRCWGCDVWWCRHQVAHKPANAQRRYCTWPVGTGEWTLASWPGAVKLQFGKFCACSSINLKMLDPNRALPPSCRPRRGGGGAAAVKLCLALLSKALPSPSLDLLAPSPATELHPTQRQEASTCVPESRLPLSVRRCWPPPGPAAPGSCMGRRTAPSCWAAPTAAAARWRRRRPPRQVRFLLACLLLTMCTPLIHDTVLYHKCHCAAFHRDGQKRRLLAFSSRPPTALACACWSALPPPCLLRPLLNPASNTSTCCLCRPRSKRLPCGRFGRHFWGFRPLGLVSRSLCTFAIAGHCALHRPLPSAPSRLPRVGTALLQPLHDCPDLSGFPSSR